jgi:hypothetical protein
MLMLVLEYRLKKIKIPDDALAKLEAKTNDKTIILAGSLRKHVERQIGTTL